MMKRLFFISVMAAAVGVPYVLSSSSDWWRSIGSQFAGTTDPKANPGTTATDAKIAPSHQTAGISPATPTPRAVEGFGAQDLGEVLQFNGTPAWVMARWPRVTAGLAEPNLQGYRVPLVTGTGEGDLAGSLTYYFDKNQRVTYITFHGTTGDPRKLIALVTSRYQFVPEKTNDPSQALYLVKWNGKPQSELRIKTAGIVRANQPRSRYQIDLAMQRP
jgi:hypothetical protein